MLKHEFIKSVTSKDFTLTDLYVYSDGKYFFLLNNAGCSAIIDNELFNEIVTSTISENLQLKLLQTGLAFNGKAPIYSEAMPDKELYFIIDITKNCNLQCAYCFRDFNNIKTIDGKVLDDILHFIKNISLERSLKVINIQMWGGEPLLAMDKIEKVHDFFKKTDIKVNIDIETNGTLITEEIAEKLFKMGVRPGISIDGLMKHQDLQRRFSDGKSSYEAVKKGINNLKKYYGDNVSGICVITRNNFMDLSEILWNFIHELGIRNLKFNVVKNLSKNDESIGLSGEEIKYFNERLFSILEVYESLGEEFTEGNILTKTENLLSRKFNSFCISCGCKGGSNIISFSMDGNIYPCEMTDNSSVKLTSIYNDMDGSIKNNKEYISSIEKSMESNIFFIKKEHITCENCAWKYFCRGGCTSRVIYSDGKLSYDEAECIANKTLYPLIISKILKKAGKQHHD